MTSLAFAVCNIGCRFCSGAIISCCTCCGFCGKCKPLRGVANCIEKTLRAIFLVLQCLFFFFVAFTRIVYNFVINFWPILYLLLALVILYFLQFAWGQIWPFINFVLIPFINVVITIYCFIFNLFITVLRILFFIWNIFVPFIGMILYFVVEIVSAIFEAIFSILGQAELVEIFTSIMELLMMLVTLVINVMLAIIEVGIEALTTMVDIVFDIITFIFSLGSMLLEIVLWVFGTLFMLLEPVLEAVVSIVGGGFSWSSRSLLSVHMPGDDPPLHWTLPPEESSSSRFMRALMESARLLQKEGLLDTGMKSFRAIKKGVDKRQAENRQLCGESELCPEARHFQPIRAADVVDLHLSFAGGGGAESVQPQHYHYYQRHLLTEDPLESESERAERVAKHIKRRDIVHKQLRPKVKHAFLQTVATMGRVWRTHRQYHIRDDLLDQHVTTLKNVTGLHSMQHVKEKAHQFYKDYLEPHTKYESPEDVIMALSMENTLLHRYFKQYDQSQHERRFWSDAESSGSNPYSSSASWSQGSSRGVGRNLKAQEFKTVANTDCFTSDPRNPLCMPDIPQNFTFCPTNLTQTNITGNETCVELGYINTTCVWCPARFHNAWIAVRYAISANPFVKLWFFVFTSVFPWLAWALFIIDPDALLSGRGIICFIFHLYDILLVPATIYLGWLFIVPLLQATWWSIRVWTTARRDDRIDKLLQSYDDNDTADYDSEFRELRLSLRDDQPETGVIRPPRRYPPLPTPEGEGGDLLRRPQRVGSSLEESFHMMASPQTPNETRAKTLAALQRWKERRVQHYNSRLSSIYGHPRTEFGVGSSAASFHLAEDEHAELHSRSIQLWNSPV